MDSFDYVIVGGGTAGCILANRLTTSGRHRVLLLEAGGEPTGMWIPIPAGFSKLLTNRKYNWRFATTPEPGTNQRREAKELRPLTRHPATPRRVRASSRDRGGMLTESRLASRH